MRRRVLPDLTSNLQPLPPITSRYLSRLPCIIGLIGSTGSGKSHLALGLVKRLRTEGSIDRVYLISPTCRSNILYQAVLTPEDHVYEDIGPNIFSSLKEVEVDCAARAEQYRLDLEYAIAYSTFRGGRIVSSLQEHLLESRGYRMVHAVRPKPILILDDCSHSAIFSVSSKNPFVNLVLRSRHCGGGTGLSIMMIAQTFTSGIPRCLRQNFTHLAVFRTESRRERKSIYEEVGGMVSEGEFNRLFESYTLGLYSYLWVDFIRKRLSSSF